MESRFYEGTDRKKKNHNFEKNKKKIFKKRK